MKDEYIKQLLKSNKTVSKLEEKHWIEILPKMKDKEKDKLINVLTEK